ncbi:MAG: GntR family transcriptional regulator [Litorilinea sp.]|nr:MAG: GntR family transcriptional regulator [Litorilinea sp.]
MIRPHCPSTIANCFSPSAQETHLQEGGIALGLSLKLDRQAGPALYQQLAEQIKLQIVQGRLPAGTQLPTVRELARTLGVTRVTVQMAYHELQNAGLVEATVGRGTFVSRHVEARPPAQSLGRQLTPDAVVNDILQLGQIAGLRSLADAAPDASLFPAQEFWQALDECRGEALEMVRYGASQGDPLLRVEVARLLQDRGMAVTPDEVLIVAGVTQGLALVAQALARPGEPVLVEQPTYLGFLHTLKAHGVQPLAVPLDEEGPIPEAVERLAIQQRPRFFYTVPTFQNPTGVCATPARRAQLLALAEQYGFLLVEDDLYARLSYEGPPPPAVKSLDRSESVIHVGGFSKLLMPGLRLGYVVAPPPIHERLLSLRRAMDLCSPPLLQRALARFLHEDGLKRHLRRVLPLYRQRRDALLAALRHHMPPAVQWTRPQGGFCVWLTLPRRSTLADLQQAALQQGWAFAPGEVFLTRPSPDYHLRLCFGAQPPEWIAQGVEVLANLIRERLDRQESVIEPPSDWLPLV